jgi:hypothetical protein
MGGRVIGHVQTVHDYYRIADVSDGSSQPRADRHARWWPVLPAGCGPRAAGVERGRLPRVLNPQTPFMPLWRDDVALDFPSARSAAERMRQAFLAAEWEPGPRAVVVSVPRGAAGRSARVPVHLDVQALCGGCGGRGEAWGEACHACAGDGSEAVARYVLIRVPAGVRHDTRLRYRIEVPHAAAFDLDVHVIVT